MNIEPVFVLIIVYILKCANILFLAVAACAVAWVATMLTIDELKRKPYGYDDPKCRSSRKFPLRQHWSLSRSYVRVSLLGSRIYRVTPERYDHLESEVFYAMNSTSWPLERFDFTPFGVEEVEKLDSFRKNPYAIGKIPR